MVNKCQSLKVQALKKISEYPVSVQQHRTLNSSNGAVVCRVLNCAEEEIIEEMSSQGVIHCGRLTMRRNGDVPPSAPQVFTFNKPNLPDRVGAGIHRLDVCAFIPQLMRCFKWQRFGHTAVRFVRQEICVCIFETHEDNLCKDPTVCINCKGHHNWHSRNCPVHKLETAIQEVMILHKISYPEARKIVSSRTP
ncbi:uncharacterized protein LOC142317981 [Lycorma delicatula]|uniref:uncharacterized protein LOC142317981 n=1 Tax=Lycorma delicatula TaxID=130591 RepID=UPI003F50D5BA